MDYRGLFEDAVDTLRQEKRYRVFADLERIAGNFPRAVFRDSADNAPPPNMTSDDPAPAGTVV